MDPASGIVRVDEAIDATGGEMRERYGPSGWAYFFLALGGALLALAPICSKPVLLAPAVPLLFVGKLVLLWFVADEHGLRRRGLLGSPLVRWEDVGGVEGVRARPTGLKLGTHGVLIQRVVDRNGRLLFTLGPYLPGRRQLVLRIHREIRQARKRDESNRSPPPVGSKPSENGIPRL
jgi:hypothetical protein